jgi:1,4-alpha-glucan branching enzyme
MKKYLLPFIVFYFSVLIFPQVTTLPQYPTENDSITIYLDTTQPGAEELLNYTGTLYAHTGVNTSVGNWQHVIGSWGNNSIQPALTRLGANSYQLKIGYPRQFYSVTNPAEKILALAFVFRTSDGTKQTRPDIFVNLYEPGITIVINNPTISLQYGDPLRSPAFASQNDTVNVDLSIAELGTAVSAFALYVNDVQVAQTSSNHITYQFVASEHISGQNKILAVAADTSNLIDSTEFIIFVNPLVQDASVPPGKVYGINYDNSTTVTLALFAPYKKFVYVLGDFNDWKVNADYYMKRDVIDSNNVVWWVTISGLTPSQEYAFQYYVDGEIRIADPYTEKVLDPWNDQYISNITYPNLKPYPAGKTSEIVSVLQTAQTPYSWQITNFQKPAKTDLVIYELLIRDFLSTHSYKTLYDTLNYLKTLGVNAIELMPINEFEGNVSWGYNPSFHLALDKYYGPKDSLKKLIDKAHEMGIAVIFDMVLNHAYGQSPLVRLYWDSFNNRPAANNPWFNVTSPNPVFSFGNDFNHESQATKNYVDRVNRFWLEEYKFDGYRFDFTKGFTNTPGDGGAYDQARINILKRMTDKIWEYDSSAYVILEHFAANSEEVVLSNYGMMLWGNMNYQYNEATMGYASDLSGGYYKSRGWTYPHLVTYMESHDEERLMYKNLMYGNSSGSYSIRDINTAINRMKLAAAFFFTIPGPKMIWQFGELGYDYSINFNGRTGNKPIRWDYFSDPKRLKLYKVFAELINLKKNYDAFRSGTFTTVLSGYAKRINITHSTMDVAIVGNFHVIPISSQPTFSRTGTWYDFFSGDSIIVTNVDTLVTLQPGEFKIYTTVKLPTPEPGLITEIESEFSGTSPSNFELFQNYPNPFNPTTAIRYAIPLLRGDERGVLIKLIVYDVLGNEVATLVNEEKPAGSYEVEFSAAGGSASGGDVNNLSSGVYFYQLKAGNFLETKKMILLR